MELPLDVHYEILKRIPPILYEELRTICKDWRIYIDNSDYKIILDFYRNISRKPDCVIRYEDVNGIWFNLGFIQRKYNAYKFDGTCTRKVNFNKIVDTLGSCHLFKNRNLYKPTVILSINGREIDTDITYKIGCKITYADDKCIKFYSYGTLYTYDIINNTTTSVVITSNHLSYYRDDTLYVKNSMENVDVIRNGMHIGVIRLPSTTYGFNDKYFVMKYRNEILFWNN